jgi:hypothetical protein
LNVSLAMWRNGDPSVARFRASAAASPHRRRIARM